MGSIARRSWYACRVVFIEICCRISILHSGTPRTRTRTIELIASDRAPLRYEDNPKMQTVRTTLGEYIDYMQRSHHGPLSNRAQRQPVGWTESETRRHPRERRHMSVANVRTGCEPPDLSASILGAQPNLQTQKLCKVRRASQPLGRTHGVGGDAGGDGDGCGGLNEG